jgi:hypothetical protein
VPGQPFLDAHPRRRQEHSAPSGQPQLIDWCLDKEDLCVTKLCAFREKDQNFVAALLKAKLIDVDTIVERLPTVEGRHHKSAERAISWLRSWDVTSNDSGSE